MGVFDKNFYQFFNGGKKDEKNITWGISFDSLSDEETARFKEAIYATKGRANSRFGASLVIAGASISEIKRLCSNVLDEYQVLRKPRQSKRTAIERSALQAIRACPNFWDTIKGRKLKERNGQTLTKMGIDPSEPLSLGKVDVKVSSVYLPRSFEATGRPYIFMDAQRDIQYSSDLAQKLTAVEIFSPIADVKFSNEDAIERLSSWAKGTDTAIPSFDEYRKYEVDSFAHMDEAITEKIKPYELACDVIHNDFNSWFVHSSSSNRTIELGCVIEAFYAVCKEVGIVGVINEKINGRRWVSPAAMKGIMKNVIKFGGTYRRLVKSGFSESVARETVLGEINENIAKRASRPSLRFYPRNDYKDTPAEEREIAKKKAIRSGGGSRKRVMTVEEFAKVNKKEDE